MRGRENKICSHKFVMLGNPTEGPSGVSKEWS